MVSITKEEKELILDVFPGVKIIRSMKQKSKRHNYFVEENPDVKEYLNKIRNQRVESKDGKEVAQDDIDWSKYYKNKQRKPRKPYGNGGGYGGKGNNYNRNRDRNNDFGYSNYDNNRGHGRGKSNYGNKNKERYDKRDFWN